MTLNITPVKNHREREKGIIIYPVYSRRSGGISLGINLFPDKKNCQFNCPYCEVFPFSNNAGFSLEQMQNDLLSAIETAHKEKRIIKDICFSGNGEPTLSPAFTEALKLAEDLHLTACNTNDQTSTPELVVITNGTGLLQPQIFSLLEHTAVTNPSLNIWLKLDAGTPEWYKKINRCPHPHENLIEKIKEFASSAPVTIQTMLCAINNEPPPEAEAKAWETLVCELAANAAANSGKIRKIQIYGKARPSPEDPLASELPADYLEKRGASLLQAFAEKSINTPVEIYL